MTKIKVREIAELAGVSAMTVSNVIRGKDSHVSKEMKEKILQLIKQYNYVPNQNASNLRTGESSLIGILFYDKRTFTDFTDPFMASILTGVTQEAKRQGYFLMVHVVHSPRDIEVIQRNWKFAGFIVAGVENHDFAEINKAIKIPATYIDTYREAAGEMVEKTNFIMTDDEAISEKVASYLEKMGHKKVLFFTFDFKFDEPSVMERRFRAFQKSFSGEIIFASTSSSDYQEILENVEPYLMAQPFTAIYATADILAVKLHQIFKDLSIISVDNAPFAEFLSPKLTTVAIDQVKKGRLALRNLIETTKSGTTRNDFMSSELIERDSVNRI